MSAIKNATSEGKKQNGFSIFCDLCRLAELERPEAKIKIVGFEKKCSQAHGRVKYRVSTPEQ
jgi:hypothetical protein